MLLKYKPKRAHLPLSADGSVFKLYTLVHLLK